MVSGMKSLTYEELLRTLVLYLMEFKKMRGDLTETFRILNGLDRMDVGKMFPVTREYGSLNILLQLYKTLVTPHLENCMQFWLPCYRMDIINLERVQKRFIRMLPGLEGLSYKERLGLFTLEPRKLRCDLIEVYKIMTGI
eukprot:g46649.t1